MRVIAWVLGFVVLAVLPFFLGSYHNDVYRKLLLWVTLALGYNFLFGICGQVAFSHFAFYGIGAYSVVILLFQANLPLPVAIVLGIAICVALALAVAIPATRLEGFYLALVTLALAQLFIVVLNEGGNVTGGTGGIANYRLPAIFGLDNAFLILFMVIVGGAGRHAGAVIGAVLLFLLPFWLSPIVGHHHQLIFGLLVVASILLWPKGLIGVWDRFSR